MQAREKDHAQEQRRGRPRSEAAERAILDAVVTLVTDGVPLGALSIERIARTAGVGKATIYRRWQGKEELFVDVLREVEVPEPALPGISALEDLVVILESMRVRGVAQRSSTMLHNVFVEMKSQPKLWETYQATVIAPRRRIMVEVVLRAISAGELRDDVDPLLISDLLTGPMLIRTVHQPDAELPDDLARRIVDTVLEGLRPANR